MLIQDSQLAENTVRKQPIHHRSYFCNRTWLNFLSTSLWIKTFPVLASPLLTAANAEKRSFLIFCIIIFALTCVCFSLKGYFVIHIHPDPATNLQFSLNCSKFEILGITGRNGTNSYSQIHKV